MEGRKPLPIAIKQITANISMVSPAFTRLNVSRETAISRRISMNKVAISIASYSRVMANYTIFLLR